MKLHIIYIIFILSFSKGIFVLMGIPDTVPQLLIEFFILIIFTFSIQNLIETKTLKAPGLKIFIVLTIFILISFLMTEVSGLQFMLFSRQFFIYPLFFYSLLNLGLNQKEKKKIISLLFILFTIQIPAAFIKLIVLGEAREKIVGTITVMEGSLSTIMPLFPIVYLISRYLYDKKLKNLFFILLFAAIGLISNRLGILIYVIFLFLFISYLHSNPRYLLPNIKFLRKTAINSIYIILFSIAFVSINPRGNPENEIGGSIDINYLIEFTGDYQTLDLQNGVEGDGRFDAPFIAFYKLYHGGIKNLIIGFGPGEIVKSSFINIENPLLQNYNIGYGGRLGIVWIMMQLGMIGLAIFLFYHFILMRKVWKIYKVGNTISNFKILNLTTLGFSIIFFIDIFTYSSELILSPVVTLSYFYGIYYILSTKEISIDQNKINFNQ